MDLGGAKVLVTGAGGFIGSHLVEALLPRCASVRALVRYNSRSHAGWIDDFSPEHRSAVEVVFGDLQDPWTCEEAVRGCDAVFHLGALIAIPYSYVHPSEYVRVNVEGTSNLLHAARMHGVSRFLHTSTSEVYGTARKVPIDETHPRQPQSPYSASKIAADALVESFHLSFDFPAVTVRPFNTFGPRQSMRAVIPTIIVQALTSKVVRLGALSPTRDFTFVKDTAEGMIRMAEADEAVGRNLNLGVGREISIGDLAGKILEKVDRPVRLETEEARLRPSRSEVNRLLSNPSAAKELVGWEPGTSLDEGLDQTIEWIRPRLGEYRIDAYHV